MPPARCAALFDRGFAGQQPACCCKQYNQTENVHQDAAQTNGHAAKLFQFMLARPQLENGVQHSLRPERDAGRAERHAERNQKNSGELQNAHRHLGNKIKEHGKQDGVSLKGTGVGEGDAEIHLADKKHQLDEE